MASNGNGNGQLTKANQVVNSLADFVKTNQSALKQIATSEIDLRRLYRMVVNLIRQTPNLQTCNAQSIFKAMQQAAEVGLEPGNALGLSYLVPYGQEAQFMIGYRGFLELARRSGQIASIQAFVVYENDLFHVNLGDAPSIQHTPSWDGPREDRNIRFVYAVARMKDGTMMPEVMTKSDVDKIRERSRAGKSGPWVTDYAEMAKKTVVRRLAKYLPLSIQMARAVEIDQNTEFGPLGVDLPANDEATRRIAVGKGQAAIAAAPEESSDSDIGDDLDQDITDEDDLGMADPVASSQTVAAITR